MIQTVTERLKNIKERKIRVGVIGLGYVGLPTGVQFAQSGFKVTGFDVDAVKVKGIQSGKSHVEDVPSTLLKRLVKAGSFEATTNFKKLSQCQAIMICVPTPLNRLKEPDLTFVLSAVETVRQNLKVGQLIILESTTYPGTTEEAVCPLLETSGKRVGKDFYLCFSPERIDPGNKDYPVHKIPKVIGGMTPNCTRLGVAFYLQAVDTVVPVSSTRTAEFTKLLENTFRIVNIGLVNELAKASEALGIDVWEAVEAAKTKPFGFMPFYPGPGIGGHCIGIDPLYLSWKAKLHGSELRFVDLASQTNGGMPAYVVKRMTYALNKRGLSVNRTKILILGVSYKRNVADTRESPAIEIIEELASLGARIDIYDPFISKIEIGDKVYRSIKLEASVLKKYQGAILVTDHTCFDGKKLVQNLSFILDTRNALRNVRQKSKIETL